LCHDNLLDWLSLEASNVNVKRGLPTPIAVSSFNVANR